VIVFILKILKSLPNEFAAVAFLAGRGGKFLKVGQTLNKEKIWGFRVATRKISNVMEDGQD